MLRLFFYDCFVNDCDASILLDDDDTPWAYAPAVPNANSLRGFDVVDAGKATAESACGPCTVSYADMLALAVHDAVALLGGPSWTIRLGRGDARMASHDATNALLLGPTSNVVSSLIASFRGKGLSVRDMMALSGMHTIGRARCATFRGRVINGGEVPTGSIDAGFTAQLRGACGGEEDNAIAPLDALSPDRFDNGVGKLFLTGTRVEGEDLRRGAGGGIRIELVVGLSRTQEL
jgi:peroxidase